ncbi:hypothetical protein OF83DRAFT_1173143 [Amylostereum chailletii]|nr:hypothetical protein OF83DRAFT_1173143 [Amylostereum chailletii]
MDPSAADTPNSAPSKRWTQFYAALQLAIQRAAHKWTYKDFQECFPLWCEEQPKTSEGVFSTVSQYMERHITEETNKVFARDRVQERLDRMHAVVTEARARHQSGEVRADVWREDLDPRTAVRARTIPVLESEADRLRAQLASMEEENMRLQTEIETNVKEKEEAEEKIKAIFAFLDDVYARWSALPAEDMQTWAMLTAETQNAINAPK